MKKVFYLLCIALAFATVSCKKDPAPADVDDITEDGFYVVGEATGQATVTKILSMANGHNEAAENALRAGMYEKYIVLEANKEFSLAFVQGGKQTAYGATLTEFTPESTTGIYDSNPTTPVLKGALVIGDSAPKMKVTKAGLYHIVLDLNQANDLTKAQILVSPVTWGVRGGMNGWGFTAMEATPSNDGSIKYTITGQELATGGEFKFAYNNAWKITLDEKGEVKANTNLGKDAIPGGENIKVEGAGKYDITLIYKPAAGDIANSYSYTVELKEASSLPEVMYMIGEGIEGWGLEDNPSQAVAMHPFHSQPGAFWAIRYIEAGKGFKFSSSNTKWGSDFTGLGGDPDGYTVSDGNCFVAESGLYTLEVDMKNSKVIVEPAVIVGMAEPFGNAEWDANLESARFTINGKLASFTTVAAGEQIRTFVRCKLNEDWWHAEFIPKDGGIVYREGGNDPEKIAVAAGVTITYDFNANASEIGEGGPVLPKVAIDGDFSEWGAIEPVPGDGAIKAMKMIMGEDKVYFYLLCDKDKMVVNTAMAYAHKVYFGFFDGEEEYVADIWLLQSGQATPITWGVAGFAGKGVVGEDTIEFEISIGLDASPVLAGDFLAIQAHIDGQYCDTSSGHEEWGGTTDSIGNAPAEGEGPITIGELEAPFESAFNINWAMVFNGAEGDETEGQDALYGITAIADANYVYVLVGVDKDYPYWEQHTYANRSYLCFSDGTEGGSRWTQTESKKIEGWLMYNAEPAYKSWDEALTAVNAVTLEEGIIYFEMKVDRAKIDVLAAGKDEAYVGFFTTDTYNDGSTSGSRAEDGFAPAKGESMLKVKLPAAE